MKLTERIHKLCEGKNTNFAALERTLGLGQGTIRKWDRVSQGLDKLQRVADYFNVTLDYLVGRKENFTGGLDSIYFNFAKDAEKNAIDPEDIKLAIETIRTRSRVRIALAAPQKFRLALGLSGIFSIYYHFDKTTILGDSGGYQVVKK